MTLRNRVRPDGTFEAVAARGTLTGNRGILHVADRQMGPALWTHRAWICCTLDWQGRRRTVMSGRTWTELFFLDEAVAMAAGHRPCGYCRRAAFDRFKAAWAHAFGPWPGVQAVDAALHRDRAVPGARALRTHPASAATLPHGAVFHWHGQDWLMGPDGMRPFAPDGWGPAQPPAKTPVLLRTPPTLVTILAAGYTPHLHPSATTCP
ncbi:MAG: hypothetical protein AAFY65_16065 [Pseudomonadota bacterium]